MPEQAVWLPDYLHELKTFPKSRYDDQVGSTSQALEWLKQRPPFWSVVEAYRMLANGAANESSEEVVLLAPPDCTTVYDRQGIQHTVKKGKVIVPKEDVPGLLMAGYKRA